MTVDPVRDGLLALNPYRARTVAAVFERMFPADEHGAGAVEIGAVTYLDRALAGYERTKLDAYMLGLDALDAAARTRYRTGFAACGADEQDDLIGALERGELPAFVVPDQREFFAMMRGHLQEGLFADPAHGGNRDKAGWRFLGHPGIWFDHSAEEHLAPEPVTRAETRALADAGYCLGGSAERAPTSIPGYDPQRAAMAPTGPVDVVIVGMGAVGGFVAPMLTRAGLRVVGLEAGGWRHREDYLPDELGSAYYCRGDMGAKFLSEAPRWRRHEDEPTGPITYSLGRMMNGVGGSIVHWGGALRRMHPHHFAYRSLVEERWGRDALPEHTTLSDWPLGYDDLEPWYDVAERLAGVSGDGDATNPFIPRSTPHPMPAVRDFTKATLLREAGHRLGLHPYPTPVCVNSVSYQGFSDVHYHPWTAGFGSFFDDRWNPGLTSVPEALATGNLELRTHCRAVRVLTDGSGAVRGVEYVDPLEVRRTQETPRVILAGYTFENVRLMLLSADRGHPQGVGNDGGQVGKNFMLKQWGDVYGYLPDVVLNAHTGPAAQMMTLDDYNSVDFDSVSHGFVGGACLNVENQQLPLQTARDPLPRNVRTWGKPYKDHLREWQHILAMRIQPDALPYATDYLDLDPDHRDRSGLGLPVVRVTTDMRPNEVRLQEWMEQACARILREMGATKTWPGLRFRGVASSHDLGGARMGTDPATSVVDPDLQVHDTPGLFVFGGAVFPTCTGVNPHLTIMALTARATSRLLERNRS